MRHDGSAPETWFDAALHWVAMVVEAGGVAIIVVALAAATLYFLRRVLGGDDLGAAYHAYRAGLARGILLGIEFLVAADVIGTVAASPTLENLAVLAAIVLIRTFLSFSLEIEIEGRWPWRRAEKGREPANDRFARKPTD
jgi:uncharacterized membrane protein